MEQTNMSSIALDNNNNSSDCGYSSRSSSTRITQGGSGSGFMPGNRVLVGDPNQEDHVDDGASSDSASSSIGKNSDISGRSSSEGEDSGDATAEVQSSYKGGPLDDLDALEEVLPIRRGISRFYNGKSKSFASLAYASSSPSIQDLAKQENAYTRRRRNLLAGSLAWDKNRSSSLRSHGAGISKRLTNLSRTNLALAVAMSTLDSNTTAFDDLNMNLNMNSRSSPLRPPPFLAHHNVSLSPHLPRDFSAWRSFSLADLQCASVATTHTSGSSSSDESRSPS